MPLTGNLVDFDLADIFQIVAQEGKTGRLFLSGQSEECSVVFKNGAIILAHTSKEQPDIFLYRYLQTVKKYTATEIREIKTICKTDIGILAKELIDKQHMTADEVIVVAGNAIEDIACSLFFLKKGDYRLETLDDVTSYQISTISFSIDAITLEAARRVDEWKRMASIIKPDSTFICSPSTDALKQEHMADSIFEDFPEYFLTRIDNKKTVDALCNEAFISTYRVYETLNELLQTNKISLFSETITIQDTENKINNKDINHTIIASVLFTAASLLAIALILGTGTVIMRTNAFFPGDTLYKKYSSEIMTTQYTKKTVSAKLFFKTFYGRSPLIQKELVDSAIINTRDTRFHENDIVRDDNLNRRE